MDSVKADNERELTSTMGNVLSMSRKDEKNDTSDATPTSSTDANTTPTASRIVSDDPISSTSSDIMEQNKSKASEANIQNSLEVSKTDEPDKSSVDPEADLLEMSISNVSNEKITEDVEDLVHDLESLLGESTDSFNIPIKRKEDRKSPDEGEDRKSLVNKEDISSPSEKGTSKLLDESGDKEADEDSKRNNHPLTFSEGIQELISAEDPISNKDEDKAIESNIEETISDENVFSGCSQAEVSALEIEESNLDKTNEPSETNLDEKKSDEELKTIIGENDIESNTQVIDKCPKSNDKETSSTSDASGAVLHVECKNIIEVTEGKLDKLHKENEEIVEQNVEDSALKDTSDAEVVNKESPDNQEDKADDMIKIVEECDTGNIIPLVEAEAEITIENETKDEDNTKDIEMEEIPEHMKENDVPSVSKQIHSDGQDCQEAQENMVEDISSVSKKENTPSGVKTIITAITEIESCNMELESNKECEGKEQFKEGEGEAVTVPPKDKCTDIDVEIKDIDLKDIEMESKPNVAITEEVSEEQPELSCLSSEGQTENELAEVNQDIPDAEKPKEEECGQVDGTVLENEENKQIELAPDTEAEKSEDSNAKLEDISSQNEVESVTEVVTGLAEENNLNNPAIVSDVESQENIPESTVEILPEDATTKLENVSPSVVETSLEVIEDDQCKISQDTDKATRILRSSEISVSSPKIQIETPDAENSVPTEISDNSKQPGVSELTEIIDKVSQVEDDVEAIQMEVDNIQSSSKFTEEISSEVQQVESLASPTIVSNELIEEKLIIQSEETEDYAESANESVHNEPEVDQLESKEIIQPELEFEVKEISEPEGRLEQSDETGKESSTEAEALEGNTDTSADEKVPIVNTAAEEVVMQRLKDELENKTAESNDKDPELIHKTPKSSNESDKPTEESLPISEKESCETGNDISDSADESSKPTKDIPELNDIAKPAAKTPTLIEEISKPVEEIFDPDDSSKLENETSHEITCETLPESVDMQKQIPEEETINVVLDENVNASTNLSEESDREKSSDEIIEEDKKDNDKVIEISDEDSKAIDIGCDPDGIQVLSSGADSDSEELVPVLALEPDEIIPSPKESDTGCDDTETDASSADVHHPSDMVTVTEPLPEIEKILTDQEKVDEPEVAIDMQENLETILAVASLQNIENTQVAVTACVEPEMTETERREMEALRKAVESITENANNDFEDDVELIADVAAQGEQETVNKSEGLPQVVSPELVEEKVYIAEEVADSALGKTNESVVELKVEECIENVQFIEEASVEETNVEIKLDNEAEENRQALPDTSEDKVIDIEIKRRETKNVLPDSSQSVPVSEEATQSETSRERESKTKTNERPKRHKKSNVDNKLEELSINVDVPDREKPYSPKITIKPIKVPDEEVSTTSNSDLEFGKGSLKMTITKQSDKMHSILKICDPESSEAVQEQEEPIPKLIIKPKMQQVEQQHSPKMSTRSSRQVYSPTSSTQRSGSPRITIKPVVKPDKVESVSPLKIKIKPDDTSKKHNPKVNIKAITKSDEDVSRENVQSPRKVIIKPVVKPTEEPEQVHSPRITIKPIPKPETEKESIPSTPRLNIKPIKKQEDDDIEVDRERSSPKITIKPVVKPPDLDTQTTEGDEEVKERIVLKINKGNLPTPTKELKKREHPPDDEKSEKLAKITVKFSKGGGHPHIVQQSEDSNKRTYEEPSTPEKVKKQKVETESPISTRSKHKEAMTETSVETRSKHKEVSVENPSGEIAKTKQKETELVHESPRTKHKDPISESPSEPKRAKLKDTVSEIPMYESTRSRHKDTASEVPEATKSKHNVPEKSETLGNADDVKIIEPKMNSPIVISEDSRSQDSGSCVIVDELKDPLSAIPVFEITTESAKAMLAKPESVCTTPATPPTPTPRKRGRPRKVPIVVREDFKEQEESPKPDAAKGDVPPAAPESGRPKRSCRGQSARATLGIKPRKPRGPGRGRGSKRGMGTRAVPMKPEGEVKLSKAKLKLMQQSIKRELAKAAELAAKEKKESEGGLAPNVGIKPLTLAPPDVASSEIPVSPFTIFPVPSPQGFSVSPALLPGTSPKLANSLLTEALESATGISTIVTTASGTESSELVMVDEETRMSADTNSRAQTPAKQVIPADAGIEESQSSVQSTATTESGKAPSSRPNKAPRLEVQEPEGAVISADQLTEYYWNGNGPFMLQEQVAQFLGIKSFKRKYPGITRRMLEMQERDFIRESGLASEHMCDLGLTAVNSADILDIMYSDFQDKYEEYCKHQRDRQAKDLINKQKALTLAASQEKNKADITEQAVQSAAQWNASFNKTRKEQRKACMDLQTLTVHYPKGKIKQINKAKVGNYPVALVPGQFTDYYQEFTPTEINNLPINTMCYDPINIIPPEESEDSGSDGSDSDSDSSSSSSGSGSDSSSGVEDCKLCKHTPKKSTITK